MSPEKIHFNLKITGRVQGVGYRAFASRVARNMNLTGYVKNLPDGSVYIEVEGPRELVGQMVNQCKNGPGWAYVENVVTSEAPLQSFSEFQVKY
jgi:acylphosphatase